MEYKVLKKTERKWLRMVETSEEDARQIIARCTPLLEFVESLPTTMKDIEKMDEHVLKAEHPIGCPHCGGVCLDCKWMALCEILPTAPYGEVCSVMPFGGVTLNYVMMGKRHVLVIFSPEEARVTAYLLDVVDAAEAREYRKDIRLAKRFLLAHIEWAEGRLDGTL